MTGAPGPLQVFHNKFRKIHFVSATAILQSADLGFRYSTPSYSLSHLGSLTSLAILSMAAPQASPSNGVNSGNYEFDSQVSQAGGDTSVATVLITFYEEINTLTQFLRHQTIDTS